MNNTDNKTEKQYDEAQENYRALLKSLDNPEFAHEFKVRKLDRTKQLLNEIFGVTDGVFCVPKGEDCEDWAQANLMEIFELLLINHDNFQVNDFVEDLQHLIFENTKSHGAAYRHWSKSLAAERGLDTNWLETEPPAAAVQPSESLDKAASKTEEKPVRPRYDYDDASIDVLTLLSEQIAELLSVDNLPDGIHDAIVNVLAEARPTAPIIETGDVKNPAYILEYLSQTAIETEARAEFQERFGKQPDAPKRDTNKSGDIFQEMANQLSDLMTNPMFPERLREVLRDELNSLPPHQIESPENLLFNLKELANKEYPDD